MISKYLKRGALVAIATAFMANSAFALDVFGAGASFPYPIFAKWAETYKRETGESVNYQSLGPVAGIRQIKVGTIAFGASDQPLKPEELDAAGLTQWPQVTGGIVPIVNLEGVRSGDLVLDGGRSPVSFSTRSRAGTTPRSRSLIPT